MKLFSELVSKRRSLRAPGRAYGNEPGMLDPEGFDFGDPLA